MAAHIGLDAEKIQEALDGLSTRDLERMRELIDRRLVQCVICNEDGAINYRVIHKGVKASLAICPACFEKHRTPEGRSEE
jgi:hypothetical protein